jgi:hypothetical protein
MLDRLKSSWNDPARRPMLVLGLGAVAIAIVLLVIAFTQIKPPVEEPTPTPDNCVINCGPGPQVAQIVPQVLHIRNRSRSIVPVNVSKGNWNSTADVDQAEWVFGTLVNYVIGLPASQENSDMLQAMSEADEIALDLSNGQTLSFRYAGRQFISPGSTDIFAQTHPGLTLVLLGDNNSQRIVVTANYLPDSEVGKPVPSSLAQINTPVQLGTTKVTVLSGRYIVNAPGLPVGSAFYLVDFTVENITSSPINAGDFVVGLQDYANQKYRLSKEASSLGPNSPVTGTLQPGTAATFTAGFEVPTNVTGPVLVWTFKPTPSFKAQANVAVPLVGPTPTPDPRSKITVQVTQAYFSTDQSEMIIVGGIGNPTNSPVTISPADISLSTPEGILATLHSTEPPLPINLGPGQNQTLTLSFSRLPSASAVLKVVFASFQLTIQ